MTELRHLRYFVAVAEEGQLTRAAGRLHIAQPALSQAISQLETRLGVSLFDRHARGVSLTPAGQALFGKAQAALSAVDDADLAARAQSRGGTIAWGFVEWPPMVQAPELFATFAAAYPDAHVSFRDLAWPRVSTAVWLEPVDVGMCFSPTPHPDVRIHPVRTEPRVVVAAKDHPVAQKSELSVAYVLDEVFCGGHPSLEPVRAGFWRLDDHRGKPGRTTDDRAANAQETIGVLTSGRGIMTTPQTVAMTLASVVPNLTFIPLRDADPTELALVSHADNANPLVDALIVLTSGPGEVSA